MDKIVHQVQTRALLLDDCGYLKVKNNPLLIKAIKDTGDSISSLESSINYSSLVVLTNALGEQFTIECLDRSNHIGDVVDTVYHFGMLLQTDDDIRKMDLQLTLAVALITKINPVTCNRKDSREMNVRHFIERQLQWPLEFSDQVTERLFGDKLLYNQFASILRF